MNTLEGFHTRCQRLVLDVRPTLVGSCLQCKGASGLSTIGDILRNRRLSLFGHVARLDPGVPAHDALRLMVDTKAESQWPAGDQWAAPSQRLANNKVQEEANALATAVLWRSEMAGGHGAEQQSTRST